MHLDVTQLEIVRSGSARSARTLRSKWGSTRAWKTAGDACFNRIVLRRSQNRSWCTGARCSSSQQV